MVVPGVMGLAGSNELEDGGVVYGIFIAVGKKSLVGAVVAYPGDHPSVPEERRQEGKVAAGLAGIHRNDFGLPAEMAQGLLLGAWADTISELRDGDRKIEPINIQDLLAWGKTYVQQEHWMILADALRRAMS